VTLFHQEPRVHKAPVHKAPTSTHRGVDAIAALPELWLRDGRTSILINPCEITSVSSAGNCVEFQLTGHRSHLIRTTRGRRRRPVMARGPSWRRWIDPENYHVTLRFIGDIDGIMQAQEARLASFGIVRVHRSRPVNLKRVVALEWWPSGDFELRLDSGETVTGSRRFKAAVAGIAA
jgi:DNA-binding LytR/AlgR family response regulator